MPNHQKLTLTHSVPSRLGVREVHFSQRCDVYQFLTMRCIADVMTKTLPYWTTFWKSLNIVLTKHKLIHTKESRSLPFNIPEGAAVATMVTGRGWMRAKVAALLNPNDDDENNVHLYLCDLGQFVFFPSSSLHPLSSDLLLLLNWQKVIYNKRIWKSKVFIILILT